MYRRIVEQSGLCVAPRLLRKSTLTELSHVLENTVIDHDLDGAVFTGFQRSSNWFQALDRYERLVRPRARSVAVFAAGNVASMGDDAILRVELTEDSPLVEEWFLVVLTPGFSAVLLGEETGGPAEDDRDRQFETIWSFTPGVVDTVIRFIRDEVAELDPTAVERIDAALDAYPPSERDGYLRDEVLGELISALDANRERHRAAADLERRAAAELRSLDRSKSAFLSAVSHELRTPLTVVSGLAQTLRRLSPHLDPERRAQLETALANHTERLTGLLDDLLDVDRLSRGVMTANVASFDAVQAVHDALLVSPGSERVEVTGPVELRVTLDRVQFERIVVNLVGNADKYAPGGPIEVGVRRRDGGGLILTVADHGPGIPESELERVLEPFHRVDERHPRPGTGVGLALVAEFARLHGGEVDVKNRPGGGACFTIELPNQTPPTDRSDGDGSGDGARGRARDGDGNGDGSGADTGPADDTGH